MEALLTETLQAARSATVYNSNSSSSSSSSSSSTSSSGPSSSTMAIVNSRNWFYGGRSHRVPEDFRMQTKISLQSLYRLWHDGIPFRHIGPFKFFDGLDLHPQDGRHLSSAKALVSEIEKFLPQDFKELPSAEGDRPNSNWLR